MTDCSGEYPTYVIQRGGRSVPVVQAYCYTKYLGHLHLIFDDHGELVTVDTAEVVLLDNNIDKDEMVEERLVKYQSILAPYRQVIGVSNVFLSRNDNSESNLGNLVTDSMLEVWIWEGAQVGDTVDCRYQTS